MGRPEDAGVVEFAAGGEVAVVLVGVGKNFGEGDEIADAAGCVLVGQVGGGVEASVVFEPRLRRPSGLGEGVELGEEGLAPLGGERGGAAGAGGVAGGAGVVFEPLPDGVADGAKFGAEGDVGGAGEFGTGTVRDDCEEAVRERSLPTRANNSPPASGCASTRLPARSR
ncbi:MAG: hypothetical protein LBR07_06115 [Puniceicoccales bacterium]|nr:hypothetical protein [Puniceicoccales bacterium]